MKSRAAWSCLAAFLVAAAAAAQTAQNTALVVGDPAPNITVSKWVKGTPVTNFEKGKLYVVEFWATWCGPCKVSIPHLTELAKKFKDVNFVGVSVWENDQKGVAPFVKQMGDKMGYNVAMDQLPTPTAEGSDGVMAKTWMEAAGQNGIPTAFVVDKEGKIAWIGHPMALEEPLTKIVNGTYTADDYAKAKLEQQRALKVMDFQTRFGKAMAAKDEAGAMAVLDEMLADPDPDIQGQGGMIKFNMLLQKKDYDAASTLGNSLVTGALKDNADALNSLAWSIVDPKGKVEKKDLDLALAAAQRAVELDKNYADLDTLARVYFDKGDKDKAIATEKEAIALAPDDQSLKDALKEFGG